MNMDDHAQSATITQPHEGKRNAAIIINPYSSGMTSARERKLVLHLREHLNLDVLRTERAGHASKLAQDITSTAEHELIIACGGDGTANEILNGMGIGKDTADSRPAFAIIPAGGTNVMSRSLGFPNHPIRALKSIVAYINEGRERVINLGKVDERVFMFSAGVGIDAEVVKRIEMRRSGRRPSDLTHAATIVGIYAAEKFKLDASMDITIEDTNEHLRAAMLSVGNTTPLTYLGRMPLHFMPDCSLDLGLDLIAPEQAKALFTIGQVMEGLSFLPRRGKTPIKMQRRHNIDSIRVKCEEPTPLQADGEYLGDRTDIHFQSLHRAIRLVC